MTLIALATAFALSGQAAPPPRGARDLTRDLNSAPPSAASAAPRPATPAPAATDPRAAPAPSPAQRPAPAPQATAPRPAAIAPSTRPAAPATAPQATPAMPQTAPAPAALDAAGVAALPFRIELPAGVVVVPGRAGADAAVYRIQRDGQTLVMIYAGPSSQFPIYDGDMVRTGARASIVVNEAGRRLAMEHLFQRAAAPKEIHVWVASVAGADRDLAERIGQSVDPR